MLLAFAVPAAGQTYVPTTGAAVSAAYPWIDISTSGTTVALADDANSAWIGLGFTFTYGGTARTQVRIGSNGWLQFTSNITTYTNTALPLDGTGGKPNINDVMLPFWDDLNPASVATRIRYQTVGTAPNRVFVVSWLSVPHYCTGSSQCASNQTTTRFWTFQVQIHESGVFVYRYQTVPESGGAWTTGAYSDSGATVGYEVSNTDFVQYSFNTASITAGLTILWARPVHHYAISYPGGSTAVTCDPHLVTITGHDAGHNAVAPPAGTVLNLSTSTGTGVWTTLVSGSGTWVPSGSNDGLATYTWPGGETSFTVRLRHNTPVTLHVNLFDNAKRTEGGGADDPNLTFANAAFRVTDSSGTALATFGTHIAGKRSDTGFGAQTRFLQAIRTDTDTGSCVGIFPGKTVTVEMAGARINPTGGASQVRILNSGGSMVSVATSAGAPPGSYTGVSLAFDAQSKAPLVFDYPDAGSIAIYARYALPSPPAGTYVTGNSNTFVVRPFGLRVSGVTTSASPSPSDPAPYVAGQNFNVTLTAVAWKTGDDADNDGVPDSDAQIATNPATPNFGLEAPAAEATLTHSLNAPAGGSAGTLGGATTFTGFSGGTKTQAVNWSEVGFINLHAASANYLGSGQNVTNSADGRTGVGRFRPAHFALSGASLANRTDKTCAPASTFTYLGEEFGLSFTLQARNSGGAVTQNYTGAYAKLALGVFANYNLGVRSGATGLTPRLSGLNATGSWSNGSAAVELRALVSRAASPEPPFNNVEYGIAPVDSDSVAMNTLDFDADVNGTPERKKLDGVAGELRYGRIRLGNANGSELLDLPVPMRLEYYAGASGWQKNTADTCSAVQASDFAFAFPADPKNQLAACKTRAIVAGTPPNQTLTLEKPGAGNHGWTDLVLNLGTTASGNRCTTIGGPGPAATTANMPYLQFKWKNPSDENPSARASFGMQPSAGPVIYRRERY